jgi:hypothetical protein
VIGALGLRNITVSQRNILDVGKEDRFRLHHLSRGLFLGA